MVIIVDESDKLFEEGHQGFRDQLGAIYRACDSSQIRRAFFSFCLRRGTVVSS